jgi:hypothetical protein
MHVPGRHPGPACPHRRIFTTDCKIPFCRSRGDPAPRWAGPKKRSGRLARPSHQAATGKVTPVRPANKAGYYHMVITHSCRCRAAEVRTYSRSPGIVLGKSQFRGRSVDHKRHETGPSRLAGPGRHGPHPPDGHKSCKPPCGRPGRRPFATSLKPPRSAARSRRGVTGAGSRRRPSAAPELGILIVSSRSL